MAKAVFFGVPGRPLAGFLHEPPGLVPSRAVVLCPPLGREHVLSYSQLRELADELAARGAVVLRFDYDGMGDSDGGLGDPDRVTAWVASIRHAVAFLRAQGASAVSLVGLRLGALLAVRAAEELTDLADLVLWDPQSSGRAFLREQRFLAGLVSQGVRPERDGSVHAFGAVFPPVVAGELSALVLRPSERPLAQRLLVISRPGEQLLPELTCSLAPVVVELAGLEQAALLEADPPRHAVETAASIVSWLHAGPGWDGGAWRSPDVAGPVLVHDRCGRLLQERPWTSPSGHLYGVLSEPAPGQPRIDAATVVLLPAATWHRIGLGRMWVELARECAADGVPALRLDLSGLGDGGIRDGQRRDVAYALEAVEDVQEAVRAIDAGHGVRLVGHCSGAWTALDAAAALDPTALPVSVHAVGTPPYVDLAGWRAAAVEAGPRAGWRQRLHGVVLAFGRRPKVEAIRFRIPDLVWRVGDRSGLLPSPARRLEALLHAGIDVQLISDQIDSVWWHAEGRAWMRAAARRPGFSAAVLPFVDHQLATAQARRMVAQMLHAQLVPGGQAGRPPVAAARDLHAVPGPGVDPVAVAVAVAEPGTGATLIPLQQSAAPRRTVRSTLSHRVRRSS